MSEHHPRRSNCTCPQVTNGLGQRVPYIDPACKQHGPITSATPRRAPAPQWKVKVVEGLESSCDLFHFITHHRPWLWLRLPYGVSVCCPLADLSDRLDQRWHTEVWS